MSQHWVWLVDVIFGAIAVLAFEDLQEALLKPDLSHTQLIVEIWVGISLMAFFLYDVAAYHLFRTESPYTVSGIGMLRFFLDVLMTFLLTVMLLAAFQEKPERYVIAIVIAAVLWHLCAALWHALASRDSGRGWPRIADIAPHFGFAAFYVAVTGVATLVTNGGPRNDQVLLSLVTAILLAAVVRSFQLVRRAN